MAPAVAFAALVVGADSVPARVSLVQIVAVGKTGDQGCRITSGGEVVVDPPPGNGHCIFAPV